MIKNVLPNKSGNAESLEKQSQQLESSSTNVHMVGEDWLRTFYKLFYLRCCVSSDQWKNIVQQRFYKQFERYFCMKLIVSITFTQFVTNLLSSLFCPLIETKNINQILIKFVVWWREIVLPFVHSDSGSASKVCQIEWAFT